jgi:monovalent cation:H+ antiporter-2, CPA2 family
LFGVSFALGAFFAGMILAESPLSHQAANETLPLRDAFAVLFFVSVGMLFDPSILLRQPLAVAGTVLIIVVGKSLAALLIVRAFRHPWSTALTISASLAQIGEFSFILAGLGVDLGLLSEEGRALVLAGALISILLNPVLFVMLDRLAGKIAALDGAAPAGGAVTTDANTGKAPLQGGLSGHAVLIGFGRVGSLVGEDLVKAGVPFLVVEENDDIVDTLKARGIRVITGNAAQTGLLDAADVKTARFLISAIPNPFESGALVEQARAANPALRIIARAHSDEEVAYLKKLGADLIIMGEAEIARAITLEVGGGGQARASDAH